MSMPVARQTIRRWRQSFVDALVRCKRTRLAAGTNDPIGAHLWRWKHANTFNGVVLSLLGQHRELIEARVCIE